MPDPIPRAGSVPSSRDRWLHLILLLALALRTYHLNCPPWDYHNWRQTNTLMVARDFARRGFRLLHPQVTWVSHDRPSDPSYFSGEFSIQSVLAALQYRVLGESDAAARVVVIAFSLLGIYFLYALLDRRAGRQAARLGALVYALLPYHLFFGRVFMPDVPALTLALGALNELDRWTDDRRWKTLLAAAAFMALALLQKLTVIFVALPALYLLWTALGSRLLVRRQAYVFLGIAALPPLAWYTHATALAHASGFSILPMSDFARGVGRWLQASFAGEALRRLAMEAFSPLGLALAVVGIFWPGQGRAAWVFRVWATGAVALLILIPESLARNYDDLLMVLPAGAALAGMALAALAARCRLRPVVTLLLILFVLDAMRSALPLYRPDRSPYDLGVLLNRLTAPQDLIVTESGGSPNVLYAADRRGWIDASYDLARLERLAQAGARYFASVSSQDTRDRREFLRALDARFQRLTPEDAPWPAYFLGAMPAPLHDIPKGEIQNPFPVNFGHQIEFLGISLRELLEWPTAFEVTYYWQCLKKTESDLRVFVHITTPSGQMVFQQDHWPLAGHLTTSQWSVGDVVRERYVVVLPGSLPPGRYQLRVGWFDPPRGPRLPIVSPSASDGEDRAAVADIEIHRAPRYRWFGVGS